MADMKDVQKSAAGVAGLWYVLGPLVLFLVVLGIGIFYWADDGDPDETPAIGTIGETADEQKPGGGDPAAPSGGTENEVESRGGKGN